MLSHALARLLVSDCLDGIGVLEDDAAGIDQFLFQEKSVHFVALQPDQIRHQQSSTYDAARCCEDMLGRLAATYNGNLAAVIGFAGSRFYEEQVFTCDHQPKQMQTLIVQERGHPTCGVRACECECAFVPGRERLYIWASSRG
eukprot:600426-Amphidinium_carterae.1